MPAIDNGEQIAYVDDRDYTIQKKVPNPEDTGSLPDLSEYVESEKCDTKGVKIQSETRLKRH